MEAAEDKPSPMTADDAPARAGQPRVSPAAGPSPAPGAVASPGPAEAAAVAALARCRVLTLPGWQGSGPGHWQSRWEALYPAQVERLEQDDWWWPRRGDWMARLDETVRNAAAHDPGRPVLLAAHSLGCLLVARWAAWAGRHAPVAGALLVAPPDLARDDRPPQLAPWADVARQRLPFPAVLVASEDDPWCAPSRAHALAADWGARRVSAGAAGHLNADSALGDWPAGWALLRTLAPGAVPI
ncbi:MAG: hypothetical protein RIQ53_4057 [Pseudomonadota bacterium]